MTVDLGDTSNCPQGGRCDTCGSGQGLMVVTATTSIGVLCLTLCADDVEDRHLPGSDTLGGWTGAADRVLRHCTHLGVDIDQMADALAAEEGE